MRTRSRGLRALVVAALLVCAGCGGEESSPRDLAIESAGVFLETDDSLEPSSFDELTSERRGSRQAWHVEFESEWGHRCVELTSPPDPSSTAAFALVRIESGERCDKLHYDAATGEGRGLYWSDLTSEAKAAYRRGFLTCRAFRLEHSRTRASEEQREYLSDRQFPDVSVVEAAENYGCNAENIGEPMPGSRLPAGFR